MCLSRGEGPVVEATGEPDFFYPRSIDPPFCNNIRRGPKGFLVWVLLFFGVLGSVAFAYGDPGREHRYPSNILRLPRGMKAVLVDKSRQRLYLIAGEGEGDLAIEKTMICATGEAQGDKTVLGDKRTPEGVYFCRTILIPPNLGRKYGVCALPLNYPNPVDKRRHRNGGGIWIHGIREDRTVRSSRGCIVLENRDLLFLARRIKLFITPVVVDGKVRLVERDQLAGETDLALEFLEKWRFARETGDMDTYKACYAPFFFSKGRKLSKWRSHQFELFKRYHLQMEVEIKDPMILRTDAYEVIAFSEVFRHGDFKAEGFRRLYLQRKDGERKIVGEEWIPAPLMREKWAFYEETLTRLTLPEKRYRIFYPLPREEDTAAENAGLYKEIWKFLGEWKEAWEEKDLDRYMSFYSERFDGGSMDLEAWKRYKSKIFMKDEAIHVTLERVMVHLDGERVSVRFLQTYQQGTFRDKGIKELVLGREMGNWKILRETWTRSW